MAKRSKSNKIIMGFLVFSSLSSFHIAWFALSEDIILSQGFADLVGFGLLAMGAFLLFLAKEKWTSLIQSGQIEKVDLLKQIIVGIVLYGILVRTFPLVFVHINQPYFSAGLFLEFARQIEINHYSLPVTIPYYSAGGIPFAYSPLPFYIEAAIINLFSLSPILVANILPTIFSSLSLVAIYFLAKEARFDYQTRLTIVFSYAVLPGSISEVINSAGLAESLGSLAIITLAATLFRLNFNIEVKHYVIIGIAWAFAILASPGSFFISPIVVSIFFLMAIVKRNDFAATKRLAYGAGVVVLTTAALTLPYWLAVATNHGLEIFTAVLADQAGKGTVIGKMRDIFSQLAGTNLPYPFLWSAIMTLGMLREFINQRYLFLSWLVVAVAVPREGTWLWPIPASVLAGIGLREYVFPFVSQILNERSKYKTWVMILVLVILGLYPTLSNIAVTYQPMRSYSAENFAGHISASEWISTKTPKDANILLVGNFPRGVREWIPYLTQRTVLNIRYGVEWEPEEWHKNVSVSEEIKLCVDYGCIHEITNAAYGLNDFYVYLAPQETKELMPAYLHTVENLQVNMLLDGNPAFLHVRHTAP